MLRYVYGVVEAAAAPVIDAARLHGIEGGRVRAVAEGPLAAAVSDVDEAVYASAPLNERIADLDWLAARAAAHQDVNARVLDLAASVLPLAFGALYRDDDRVREMLREDPASRTARLRALAGRGEWLVTIVRDGDGASAEDAGVRALDAEIAASTPGRAFLLEKRRSRVAASVLERADADVARDALDRLASIAERAYREPVAEGGRDVVVLRVSLLARRGDGPRVDDAARRVSEEIGGRGYRVRVTGPWPAYRFGSLA